MPVPPKAHLATIEVEERYGLVWLCPGTPAAKIPAMRWEDDPTYRRINSGVEEWSANALRMTDNFLDISHFPYVHTGTFGIAANTQVPKFEIVPLDEDFAGYEYEVEVANDLGKSVSRLDGRRDQAAHDDRVRPAVHGPQHDPLRDRARPHHPAVHDARRRDPLATSRS